MRQVSQQDWWLGTGGMRVSTSSPGAPGERLHWRGERTRAEAEAGQEAPHAAPPGAVAGPSVSAPTKFGRSSINKVFPDHWSFILGEVAMYCLVVLILTGVFLTFFFSRQHRGCRLPGRLRTIPGIHMTEAYRSVVRLSWDLFRCRPSRPAMSIESLTAVAAVSARWKSRSDAAAAASALLVLLQGAPGSHRVCKSFANDTPTAKTWP